MLNIGIIGLGFVGNAIQTLLLKKQHLFSLSVHDKYKQLNLFTDILESDILFICLPTPYDNSLKSFNTNELDNVIADLNLSNYNGLVLIKSTVLPTYCSEINDLYPNLKIMHNPEFLSAKTAVEDFENQHHIVLGYTPYSKSSIEIAKQFYETLFADKINTITFSVTDNKNAGLMKLACNSFYATKIQFFTELYLLCEKMNISYNDVKDLMLKNNWINPQHTSVPGHDNALSFGGACFPKDISALDEFMQSFDIPHNVIHAVISERNMMRND